MLPPEGEQRSVDSVACALLNDEGLGLDWNCKSRFAGQGESLAQHVPANKCSRLEPLTLFYVSLLKMHTPCSFLLYIFFFYQ